jgi:hypothetical protein
MNTSKVALNTKYKYKELCELLEVEEKSRGNSRNFQLKDWSRFFTFFKEGYSIIITSIKETPDEKIDNRVDGNNLIYLPHFQLILLDYMAQRLQKGFISSFEFTKKDILVLSGMCNRKFIKSEKLDKEGVTNFDNNDFYRRAGDKFSKLINRMLHSFRSRAILHVEEIYKIKSNGELFTASTEDCCKIIKVEKLILDEFKITFKINNKRDVYLKFKTKEFYEQLNKDLKIYYNWDLCYKAWKLSFCNDTIDDILKEYIQEVKMINSERKELNLKIKESLNSHAKNNFQKNEDYIGDSLYYSDEFGIHEKFKLHNDYIINQRMICDYLITI